MQTQGCRLRRPRVLRQRTQVYHHRPQLPHHVIRVDTRGCQAVTHARLNANCFQWGPGPDSDGGLRAAR
eukprot:2144027-Alexandrium_andersonii.AAC.1